MKQIVQKTRMCTTYTGSKMKDYVYMLKYTNFNTLSSGSQKGQIRILTSNVKLVIKMLQDVQMEAKHSGRFTIYLPRTNVVDVMVNPNGNPVLIYDMLACRVDALSKKLTYNSADGWIGQDDQSAIGADLVLTSQGVVEVRPVIKAGKGDSTRKLPEIEDLMKLGIVIPPEYQ